MAIAGWKRRRGARRYARGAGDRLSLHRQTCGRIPNRQRGQEQRGVCWKF